MGFKAYVPCASYGHGWKLLVIGVPTTSLVDEGINFIWWGSVTHLCIKSVSKPCAQGGPRSDTGDLWRRW